MNQKQWILGFGSGMLATSVMSVAMVMGIVTRLSPMPKPIPIALAARFLGHGTPMPLLLVAGLTAHLLYGGIAGAMLWLLVRRVTLLSGLAWGLVLWVLLGLAVLPFLGWGFFGSAVTPKIAAATLLLHLVYGCSLGALGLFLSNTSAGQRLAARVSINEQS